MSRRKPLPARQLSMARMTDEGYLCGVTEYWKPTTTGAVAASTGYAGGVRTDLFNFIDFIALGPVGISEAGIVAVQTCAKSGLATHLNKIAIDCREAAERWIAGGGAIEVHAWWREEVATITKKAKNPYRTVRNVQIEKLTLERLRDIREFYLEKSRAKPAITEYEDPF